MKVIGMQPMLIITMSTEPPGRAAKEHRDDDQACYESGARPSRQVVSAGLGSERRSRRSCPIDTTSERRNKFTTICDITANASA